MITQVFLAGVQRVGNASRRPNDPNTAWVNMEPHWGLIETLLGGTYKIRKGHRKYLPQEPRELDEAYDNRLQRSVLSPYYVRLERMLAGMLTRKPVRLDDVPDEIREQLFNVDLRGERSSRPGFLRQLGFASDTATLVFLSMHQKRANTAARIGQLMTRESHFGMES